MPRFAASQRAELRRKFLPSGGTDGLATEAQVQALGSIVSSQGAAQISLASQVAHNAADADAAVQALAGGVAAGDAALGRRIDELPVPPDEAAVQGWISDFLGINLADLVEAELDVALPVLDPPIDPIVVVTSVDFALQTVATKTIAVGDRGQLAGVT